MTLQITMSQRIRRLFILQAKCSGTKQQDPVNTNIVHAQIHVYKDRTYNLIKR